MGVAEHGNVHGPAARGLNTIALGLRPVPLAVVHVQFLASSNVPQSYHQGTLVLQYTPTPPTAQQVSEEGGKPKSTAITHSSHLWLLHKRHVVLHRVTAVVNKPRKDIHTLSCIHIHLWSQSHQVRLRDTSPA